MRLPWYDTLEKFFAPTDRVATITLVTLAIITLLIAWKGSSALKALFAIYLVSP